MYNKRIITSAPFLAASAIVFASGALWTESNIRNTQDEAQAFLIASDDGLEFVHAIESTLPEELESELTEYIAKTTARRGDA